MNDYDDEDDDHSFFVCYFNLFIYHDLILNYFIFFINLYIYIMLIIQNNNFD